MFVAAAGDGAQGLFEKVGWKGGGGLIDSLRCRGEEYYESRGGGSVDVLVARRMDKECWKVERERGSDTGVVDYLWE